MVPIVIRNLSKRYGSALALEVEELRIEAGELFFLLGPSGCGKTTLLRILAGFVPPDRGDIFFGDHPVTSLPPRLREAAMVFQTYALWPHMTVARNIAYGLQVRRLGRQEIARRVAEVLKLVRMESFEDRRPTQLSGGQQQRVALARALAIRPRLLLLDEPLSNLDARLRDELREEIRRLHQETGLTMIYVTHDQKEALALADRLAIMNQGRLVQVGKPAELYQHPLNRFVAGFLGDTNFLSGTVRALEAVRPTIDTALGPLQAALTAVPLTVGASVLCSIRPQALTLNGPASSPNRIDARVDHVAFLGDVVHWRVTTAGNTSLLGVSLPQEAAQLRPGEAVTLTVSPDQVVIVADK